MRFEKPAGNKLESKEGNAEPTCLPHCAFYQKSRGLKMDNK